MPRHPIHPTFSNRRGRVHCIVESKYESNKSPINELSRRITALIGESLEIRLLPPPLAGLVKRKLSASLQPIVLHIFPDFSRLSNQTRLRPASVASVHKLRYTTAASHNIQCRTTSTTGSAEVPADAVGRIEAALLRQLRLIANSRAFVHLWLPRTVGCCFLPAA